MRWIRFLPLWLLLLVPQASPAQPTGIVTGVITTRDGEPLPGARVAVADTTLAALTDAQGRFMIRGLPAGEWMLRAQLSGYRAVTRRVTVAPGESVSLAIELTVDPTLVPRPPPIEPGPPRNGPPVISPPSPPPPSERPPPPVLPPSPAPPATNGSETAPPGDPGEDPGDSSEPVLGAADEAIAGMPTGTIAFNTPERVALHETVQVQLVLGVRMGEDELVLRIEESGPVETHQIRVGDRMAARLVAGPGFEVQPITPEVQTITSIEPTEWRWNVTAIRGGTQRLELTLDALIDVEGERVSRSLRTFSRTIEVQVSGRQRVAAFVGANWQWLWAAIVFPLIGIGWQRLRRKRPDSSG